MSFIEMLAVINHDMKISVPDINDSEFIRLEKLIDSDIEAIYISVETVSEAKENFCFPIVQEYVKKHGGKMICGWQIWKSDILIEAEYHAVWKNGNGIIKDISF